MESIKYDKLTKAEEKIMKLLSKGYNYKEITQKLYISISTVKSHIYNIYQKYQLNSSKKNNPSTRIKAVLIYLKSTNRLKDWDLDF